MAAVRDNVRPRRVADRMLKCVRSANFRTMHLSALERIYTDGYRTDDFEVTLTKCGLSVKKFERSVQVSIFRPVWHDFKQRLVESGAEKNTLFKDIEDICVD
jgi:hypothetical protein